MSGFDRFSSALGVTRTWLEDCADGDPRTAAPLGRQSVDFSVQARADIPFAATAFKKEHPLLEVVRDGLTPNAFTDQIISSMGWS
jgi:hypothetical protein